MLDVLWVEAIEEIYTQLVANIADFPKQRAILALVTDRDRAQYDFHVANNDGASSSVLDLAKHRDIWPEVHYVDTRQLPSIRLDTLFREHDLAANSYQALVLDVQGAELMVLKGAGALLGGFNFVRCEAADFESYAGGARLVELDRYMNDQGFVEIARNAFAQRDAGGTYWDVVWKRS
jgi:FkbM family methyltransferase